MIKKEPLVSFVILNWNGKKWLKKCLSSIGKVSYKTKEILVVNNGSIDDSAKFLRENYPEIKVIELKKNVGYAKANNIGAKKAKGKYIFFLNNDTTVTPSFLNPLIKILEEDFSIGVIQPQMRSMIYPDRMDSVISYLTSTGFLYHFGYMKPWNKSMYQKQRYGLSIKGAGFIMRRKEYIILGGLDEDFVCYVEETDLCHRVWLSGKKVLYEPKSIMYHWGGGDMQSMTKDEVTMFRSYRNRFVSFLKNSSVQELLKILPLLFLFCEFFVLMTLFTGNIKRAIGAQLGILSIIIIFPSILEKRNKIQSNIRKVSDKEINSYVLKNPRLSYYYYFFNHPERYKD